MMSPMSQAISKGNNVRVRPFRFRPWSKRQKQVFLWWTENSPYKDYNGIIADGSIRSGKTLSMSMSFVFWAMYTFAEQDFAFCGKTIGSLRRNVINNLIRILLQRGYQFFLLRYRYERVNIIIPRNQSVVSNQTKQGTVRDMIIDLVFFAYSVKLFQHFKHDTLISAKTAILIIKITGAFG